MGVIWIRIRPSRKKTEPDLTFEKETGILLLFSFDIKLNVIGILCQRQRITLICSSINEKLCMFGMLQKKWIKKKGNSSGLIFRSCFHEPLYSSVCLKNKLTRADWFLEGVGSLHDGRHGSTVQRLRQGISCTVRLKYRQHQYKKVKTSPGLQNTSTVQSLRPRISCTVWL